MKDCFLIKIKKYEDNRGFFFESYNKTIADNIGVEFYQDNCSFSKKGVVRGLHYQWGKPMGKLITVPIGKIIDTVVDIRHESPTFGKSESYELSDESDFCLWIPPGFAHGFETIEDSLVIYKCSSFYNSECEASINFLDEDLNLNIYNNNVIMSDRDKKAISFKDYCKNPKF
jgi:dTDP-4-dehydrorhamnose 3,5-epimerase